MRGGPPLQEARTADPTTGGCVRASSLLARPGAGEARLLEDPGPTVRIWGTEVAFEMPAKIPEHYPAGKSYPPRFAGAKEFREEKDSLGTVKIPAEALYGVQAQRGYENFRVTGWTPYPEFVEAYTVIKKACVAAGKQLGGLDERIADALIKAADEVLEGKHRDHFIIDHFQAGAGTSFNMNVNEVLANRALDLSGGERGDYKTISPNDHANFGQSTNDSFPTAMRLACLDRTAKLVPIVASLASAFEKKAAQWKDVLKSGRTHLQDAVPITLGQEFRAYGTALRKCIGRLEQAADECLELPIGGNAVGTGINTPDKFRPTVVENLKRFTGFRLRIADDPREAIQSERPIGAVSAALRELAVELSRIASDLRLLSSGPTTGLAEIVLPPVQPGSSIMPGKINPVMAECLNMCCFQVIGNDTAVQNGVLHGQLELNVMAPGMIFATLMSFNIFINFLPQFEERCVKGIEADAERCRGYLESNPSLATMLNPYIGYLKAAEIAKQSVKEGRSVLEIVREQGILSEEQIEEVFSPENLTGHLEKKGN